MDSQQSFVLEIGTGTHEIVGRLLLWFLFLLIQQIAAFADNYLLRFKMSKS